MIEYDIWKITHCGRQAKRYYESEKTFSKAFNQFKKYNNVYKLWEAYRFTSDGWKEIKII
jgi:hypothetical protein